MSFHVLSGDIGFLGDDAGDSSMNVVGRAFFGWYFIVFMIYWMPYGFLGFAACVIFVQ